MLTPIRIAAAVVTTAVGVLYVTLGPPPEAGAAFAEAAQKLHDAHTLTYRMTVEISGQARPMAVRYLFKEPGLIRFETEIKDGPVTILDVPHGHTLILNPATKSALVMEGKLVPDQPGENRDIAVSMAEGLRDLAGKKGEPVGRKSIGGAQAQGFRVKEPKNDMTVWVDPKTKLPVQVDQVLKFAGREVHATISNIALDTELSDSLFRTEPPEGYTVQQTSAPAQAASAEQAVIRLLRAYAQKTGGRFPKKLDDFDDFAKVLSEERRSRGEKKAKLFPDLKTFQLAQDMARLGVFLYQLKDEYGYNPEEVKLGDADKILFWFKPAGAEKPRAIFGDLHVADVNADQLPPKPRR